MKTLCGLFLVSWLVLTACAAPPTPTPIIIEITATDEPATPTPLPPPPTFTRTPAPTRPPVPTPTLMGAPAASDFKYRIVAYYPSWGVYARQYSPTDIPVEQLTHINYAFGKINLDTLECVYADSGVDDYNLFDLRLMKQNYPHFKVLLSLGGWTLSDGFSDAALTPESRQKFVKSCIDLYISRYPDVVDGFDIDWEYPVGGGMETNTYRPEDKRNMTLLMQEFRRQLDELGQQNDRHYLLTAAVPASPVLYQNFELKELADVLDWMNIMAYDYHGAWDTATNFNAPLYRATGDDSEINNVDATVKGYLAAGVPPAKINLGLPFYGRGWSNVSAKNNGLYQSADELPMGTFSHGYYDYWDLVTRYIGKGDYQRHWNDEAKVPWLYSPSQKVFITYDDAESIGLKADYIAGKGLGGVMVWDLSNDDGSLLNTLHYRFLTRHKWKRP